MFVTSLERLATNIGASAAKQVQAMILAAGQGWLDLGVDGKSVDDAVAKVRAILKQQGYVGVVLIGGLDVVPAECLSVLDPSLRTRIDEKLRRSGGRGDSDNFIIWNDDCYGDKDGDRLPEIPVSRIPDGRNAALVMTQLQAAKGTVVLSAGVRNYDRPFAESVFREGSKGQGKLWVSEPTTPRDLKPQSLKGSLYFMLHGSDTDSTRYWGEDSGETVEAVNISNVPDSLSNCTIFLGCCWGALTAVPRASKYKVGDDLAPKTDKDSLALAFLRNGASAVVGCTGTHYSPDAEPFTYFGQPMHVSFWSGMRRDLPPARAIFQAKQEYASQLPHGQTDLLSQAVELKICRQFTCLGLGW